MRKWIVVVLLSAAGVGAGIAQSWVTDFHPQREKFIKLAEVKVMEAGELEVQGEAEAERSADEARVEVVNGEVYDFGSMERGVTRRHAFIIKNTGTQPLELMLLRTSCKCTLSKVGKEVLPPGEVTEITLEWSTKDVPRNETNFNQIAEIQTNDPRKPVLELIVKGEISSKYRVYPGEIEARELVGTEESSLKFRLLHFGDGTPEVVDWKFEPAKFADLMELKTEPMPGKEVEVIKGATGGLLGTLIVKPGLPLGPMAGTLIMEVEAGGQRKSVDVMVRLNVVSDIVLTGSSDFDRFRTMLNWGTVSSAEGGTRTLFAFVKGPHRESTKLSVRSIDPADSLEVSIGPPTSLAGGRTIRYKITLTVPKGAARVDRLGIGAKLAHIVLDTTHPTTKEVNIYVRFAVR